MKLFSEPPLQPLKNKQLKEHKFTFSYHCINFLLPTKILLYQKPTMRFQQCYHSKTQSKRNTDYIK